MESTEIGELEHHTDERHLEHVLVRVITTSGAFPRTGENRVKASTHVSTVLEDAASDLRLADTTGWVAMEGGHQINTAKTFAEDGLHGTVKIHWGPPEGGGG